MQIPIINPIIAGSTRGLYLLDKTISGKGVVRCIIPTTPSNRRGIDIINVIYLMTENFRVLEQFLTVKFRIYCLAEM